MTGAPGSGKTMLARRIPTILPSMTLEESFQTTRIYSAAGLLEASSPLVVRRPFRAPHHTVTQAGLVGGGSRPLPGEVSLAHNGVLFLDELPEFRRGVLEVLRQPLEDGMVALSRVGSRVRYPSTFVLVAAMNPCPCGYSGDGIRECTCTIPQIQRYQSRISGPLMDRIDIHVEVPRVSYHDLKNDGRAEPSSTIRKRVEAARQIQSSRFKKLGVFCNARMTSGLVQQLCPRDNPAEQLLEKAVEHLGLSARAYARVIKISRTIADLEGAEQIGKVHVAEAIQYRTLDRRTR